MQINHPIVSIEGLTKRYNSSTIALKDLELNIEPGEFYGLLGPNAAGKTTLISIICGLLKFDAGAVVINNLAISNQQSIKKTIGLVPQEIALYPGLTVYENILYFGRMHGISGHELNDRIKHLLYQLQLEVHAKKQINHCSGGIRRRTNLAAGMIHGPQLLVLDEPTIGVDAQSRNMIFDYLKSLNHEGTTIIYTTHYMGEAEVLCSRVGIIDDGLIIEEGTPAELIEKHQECRDLGDVFLTLTGKALRE